MKFFSGSNPKERVGGFFSLNTVIFISNHDFNYIVTMRNHKAMIYLSMIQKIVNILQELFCILLLHNVIPPEMVKINDNN